MLSRRKFIRNSTAAASLLAIGNASFLNQSILKRVIPSSNEKIPIVGLGTWQTFDVDNDANKRNELKNVLRAFVDLGGRVIDSSPMYGSSESVVGALSNDLNITNDLFMASKVWTSGKSNGESQIQRSIKKMQKPVMDLMQIHNLQDWKTHINTLYDLKEKGKIKYIGISHYQPYAYQDMIYIMETEKLDFIQVNYSIISREAEKKLLPLAKEKGIAVLVNRPFEGGSLFRKTKNQSLPEWTKAFDCNSWGQFFLKYILANSAVTCAIPGTSKVKHLTDNMQAGVGSLPNLAQRNKMIQHINSL